MIYLFNEHPDGIKIIYLKGKYVFVYGNNLKK